MAYTPTVFKKAGHPDRIAYSAPDAAQMRWDGWLPDGEAPPPPPGLTPRVEALEASDAAQSLLIEGLGESLEDVVTNIADLVAAATPTREAIYRQVAAGHRARMNVLGTLSNGTDTRLMTRVRNVAPYYATELTVGYSNIYSSASVETPGPNPITIRAAIEHRTRFIPLFRNGSRDIVVNPGAFLEFDPTFVNIPKGDVYYVRTYLTVASVGDRWPIGTFQGVASPYGDGSEQGTADNDKTLTGSVATTNNFSYGPTSLRARRIDGTIDLVAIGDSISFGSGDSQDRGMIVRAVNDQHPLRNIGYPGGQVSDFTNPVRAGLRLRIAAGATHWLMCIGTNDLASAKTEAQIKAALQAAWQVGTDLGAQVWAATIPPRTTSTDAWATTGNQTVVSTEAIRVAVNDWIRTQPAPAAGVIDVADALETARNSGIWKAANTSDGIHPNGTGSVTGAVPFANAIATFV